jgi:hypothetical protein
MTCPVCSSVGFEASKTGSGCEFCDGTFAGSDPVSKALIVSIPPPHSIDGGCSFGCPLLDRNSNGCRMNLGTPTKNWPYTRPGPNCPQYEGAL